MDQGHEMIYVDPMGVKHPITLVADMYEDTKSLCLRFVTQVNGFPEPFDSITVNVDEMPPYMAYVKDEAENQWMLALLRKTHLGVKMWSKNQYEAYGMVQFNEEMLREMGCTGLERYHQTVTAKYCGKIDYLDMKGWPAETKYFTDAKELHLEHMDCLNCGQPHIVLKHQLPGVQQKESAKAAQGYSSEEKTRSISERMDSAKATATDQMSQKDMSPVHQAIR